VSGKIGLSEHVVQDGIVAEIGFQYDKSVPEIHLSEYDVKYPLVLTSGILVDFVDEFGYFVTDRDKWTQNMTVQINPRTANVLGIENREFVTVENARGVLSGPAWLSEDVDPRVVFWPEGSDPFQGNLASESPLSLFEEPVVNSNKRNATMVMIYKRGQDKVKTTENLIRFLRTL